MPLLAVILKNVHLYVISGLSVSMQTDRLSWLSWTGWSDWSKCVWCSLFNKQFDAFTSIQQKRKRQRKKEVLLKDFDETFLSISVKMLSFLHVSHQNMTFWNNLGKKIGIFRHFDHMLDEYFWKIFFPNVIFPACFSSKYRVSNF